MTPEEKMEAIYKEFRDRLGSIAISIESVKIDMVREVYKLKLDLAVLKTKVVYLTLGVSGIFQILFYVWKEYGK